MTVLIKTCGHCDAPLAAHKRKFCSDKCLREYYGYDKVSKIKERMRETMKIADAVMQKSEELKREMTSLTVTYGYLDREMRLLREEYKKALAILEL